ncbi:DNA polymerase III subunit delta [Marinospirillum insulare]|uniref:DNA polymerase III subunit delta n=1 Tax=Marinospirillum insulare TaxID=217169 RepID=A0ABQ5ZT32_9GAMM|nr:DNA polymerase III subunit delta [Marinospirillum insulare]GLR62606.1 DNA polymerase III subunit delta [Marinospirillum insulare]
MKIAVNKLSSSLNKQLPKIIWLTGDEPLQMQEAADLIRSKVKQQGITEREVYDVGAQFAWHSLLEATASLSLFGDSKLIEVRLGASKPGKPGGEVIRTLCQQLANSPDIFLFTSNKLDAAQTKSAWFKAVDQAGLIVQIWPISANQLPQWISQRCQTSGLTLEPAAATLLAEKVEGNLLAAAQEIEKLSLFVNKGEVLNAEKLLSLIEDASRYSLFDLADACLEGKGNRAVRILRGLQAEGTEAPLLLWALTREIRQAFHLAYKLNDGLPFDTLCQQLRIWDTRKPLYAKASKRLTPLQAQQLLQLANQCDQAIKGSGEPLNDLLLQLVVQFSGQAPALISS